MQRVLNEITVHCHKFLNNEVNIQKFALKMIEIVNEVHANKPK